MYTLPAWMVFSIGVGGAFLAWTFLVYWMHRLSHIHHARNPLWQLHRAHHMHPYLSQSGASKMPTFGQLFLWLGSWRASLDVFVVMTMPAILIAIISPRFGIPILVFHYVYEIFCSEYALDHNPNVQGRVTRIFAWGDFHLFHHMMPKRNFCLVITLWDRIFLTATDPKPGTAQSRQRQLLQAKVQQL
jgi:sterol desaturase/sphingolipid hydroxylase (fatty acid hydroxylase superfamily)